MAKIIGRINDKGEVKVKFWQLPEDEKPSKRIVGVVPDLHFPFTKDKYLSFLVETFIDKGVTDIVFIGDMIDSHALSRHETHPNAVGPVTEYELSLKQVKKYIKEFPVVKFCLGNHDLIVERQAATLGIASVFLKSFKDLWQLPAEWDVREVHEIDDVMYTHGTGFSGKNAGITAAQTYLKSTVIGHTHAWGGVQYYDTGTRTLFGMNVGALVDEESYAFAYAKYSRNKSVKGCGIVYSDKHAEFVPYTNR